MLQEHYRSESGHREFTSARASYAIDLRRAARQIDRAARRNLSLAHRWSLARGLIGNAVRLSRGRQPNPQLPPQL
jgi:hypothetical protein